MLLCIIPPNLRQIPGIIIVVVVVVVVVVVILIIKIEKFMPRLE